MAQSTKGQLIKAVLLILLCFSLAWFIGSEFKVTEPQSIDHVDSKIIGGCR
jgi:hypothetical protein